MRHTGSVGGQRNVGRDCGFPTFLSSYKAMKKIGNKISKLASASRKSRVSELAAVLLWRNLQLQINDYIGIRILS
jgi:hypothetical protein